MIHKLSDKFKIVLAVMAVVVVAAGAVTYTALSASANDVQDSLSTDQNNESSVLANSNVVITSDNDVKWSSTLAEAETQVIGRYDTYYDGGFVDLPIVSTLEVKSGTISDVQITGETFEGDPITDIYGWDFTSSIELTQAGKYTAVVTMNDGSAYTYYAQVGKKQMDPFVSFDEDVYTGDKISFEVRVCQSQVFDLGTVVNLENIDNDIRGYDCENDLITEITPDTDYMTFVMYNVINAGRYEIPLTILDEAYKNYEWVNAPDSLTATAVFNVKQAVVSGSTSVSSTDYTTNMSVADLINRLQFAPINDPDHNNVQMGKYKVEYKLYTAPIYDDAHLVTALSAGQTVYAKAVGLSSISGGNVAYRNYRLPTQDESGFSDITATITLKSPPLPAINLTADGYTKHAEEIGFPIVDNAAFDVTGETITATYLNFGYKFSQWFYSADEYNVEHNYWELSLEEGGYARGGNWIITVNGEEIIDPDSYVMKDSGTYNIVIKPKSGYSFDGVSQYKYTFTIRPFTLDGAYVKWTSWRPDNESGVKHVYTGSPIPLGKDDYELDLPALLAVDNDKLTLTFEQIVDGEVVNEAPTKAGSYTFRVKGLYGDNVKNYQLPLYNISNTGQEFYIYRQMLPDFSLTPAVQTGFNGALQTEFLEEKLIELNLGHYNNEGNFVPFFQQMPNIRIERSLGGKTFENDASIGYNSETFRYCFDFTYAGNYSIEIIATEFLNNYCWFGKDDTPLSGDAFDSTRYVWNNFAIVDQAEVNPLFAPTNISTKDDDIGIAAQIANKFKGLTDNDGNPVYTLTFGKVGVADTSSTPMDKVDGAYAEGDYYVIVDIKSEFYPSCYFAESDAYTVNGSQARINYSVSSGAVSINCKVKDYTFGDNFADGFGIEDVFTVTTSNTEGAVFDAPTYTFYDEQRRTLNPDDSSQMLNGLPRNAGVYYVVITVDYSIDGVPAEQPLSREVTLNVAKRQVGIEWLLDGSTDPITDNSVKFAYNGSSHSVSVNIKTSGLPAVNATLVGEAAINVATYTFTVEKLVGDEADNYTLGDIDTVFTIVIAPAEVTVTAGAVSNITFNEGVLDPNDLKFDVTSGSFYGDDGSNIKVAVYDKNGRLVSESQYANLGMGAYKVVPVLGEAPATMPSLTDGQYITSESANYVITIVTSTFNVTAQTLQITFKEGQSNIYGDTADLDLWTLIESVMAGSAPMSVETLKNIASIVMRKDNVDVTDISKAGVGNYTLAIKLESGDYDVVVTNPDATYNIAPRPVTVRTTEVLNHRYGDRYKTEYNHCEIDGLLEGDSLTVASHVYSFKNMQWVRVTNGEVPVTPVGQYYHVPQVNGVVIGMGIGQTPMQQGEDGKYYYVLETGNYIVTAHVEDFVIIVRAITLTFDNGESVYGDAINLWAQKNNLSDADKRSKFIYFTASGLINGPEPDSLVDVVTVCLVDGQGNEYDPSVTRIGANTYAFKIKVKSGADYVIYNGSEDVTEIIGGQFVVSPKSVAVTVTSKIGSQNATSIVYGDSLEACGITLGCTIPSGAILSGDDLGVTVGIFDSDDTAIEDISKQGVGTYYVGLVWTNANYAVTFNKISFTVEQRIVNIGANNVTSHIYGETFDLNDITWTEATANGHGDAIVNNDALDIVASVYNGSVKVTDFARLAVKDGGYAIKLSKGANSDPNYKINFTDGVFTVVPRKITIAAQDVGTHVYGTALGADELNYEITSELKIVNGDDLAIVLAVYNNDIKVTDVSSLAVAEYEIRVDYDETNANYDVTTKNATFEVIMLEIKVTYISGIESVYGEVVTADDLAKAYKVEGMLLEGDELIVTAVKNGVNATDPKAPIGGYTLKVEAPNSNYNIIYENGETGIYRITARKVSITAKDVRHTYGDALGENELGYKVISELGLLEGDTLNYTIEVVLNNGTAVAASEIGSLDVGAYEININVYETANYYVDVTTELGGKFNVVARKVTVTAGGVTNHIYGESISTLGFTGSNFVSDAHLAALGITAQVYSEDNPVADVSTLHVGTYEIRLDYPSANQNNNYDVELKTADFIILPRSIKITANDVNHTYGDALGNKLIGEYGVVTSNGTGNAIVGSDDLAITLSIQGVADSDVNTLTVGGYVIDVDYTVNNDYIVETVGGSFTVCKRIVTITFTENGGSSVYGETVNINGSNVYSHDGNLVNGDGIDDVITLSSDASNVSDVGEYDVMVTVINNNYDVVYTANKNVGKHTIVERSIKITPSDITHTYGDALGNKLTADGAFGVTTLNGTGNAIVSETDKASLAIVLQIYKDGAPVADNDVAKLNVKDGYEIRARYSANKNYIVDADATAKFTVEKRAITVSYNNDLSSIYGDTPIDKTELYSVTKGSLADGDKLTVTVMRSGVEASSTSSAGEYVVSVTANGNYAVTYDNDVSGNGKYVINKRSVTVSIENDTVVYAEDVDESGNIIYHGGRYGKTQNVTAQFNNNVDTFELGTHYNIAYTLDNVTAVPNKVGVYKVTIELSDDNYELSGESEFTYEITRKQIVASTFMWETPTLMVNNENHGKFDNGVKSYVSDILQISENGFTVTIDNGETKTVAQGAGDNTYYFDENGQLRIRIKVENTQVSLIYSVSFGLNADAQHNYELSGSEVKDGLIKRDFSVSSKTVIAVLKQPNWQYSDSPILPSTVTQIGDIFYEPSNPEAVVIRYAPVINSAEAKKFVGDGDGYDFDEIKHLFEDGTLSESFNSFNVGYYVICVTYSGLVEDESGNTEYIAIRRFDVFEVTKKELPIPNFASVKYSGTEQTLIVNYDNDVNGTLLYDIVSAKYENNHVLNSIDHGESIKATNAGEYKLYFRIKQGFIDRYTWKLGKDDIEQLVIWTIEKDNDSNTDGKYFTINDQTVTYGETYVPTDPVPAAGYEGTFAWYFAGKGGSEPSNVGTWYESLPQDAGHYWIKVVLTDGNKNFSDKIGYATLTIEQKELFLTPYGTMVYGMTFGHDKCGYKLSGFITGEENGVKLSGTVTFKLKDPNVNLVVNGDEGYELTAESTLIADNYYVTVQDGKFTVTEREVTVTINNAESQYKLPLAQLSIRSISDDYAQKDTEFVKNIELSTTASSTAVKGTYPITGKNLNANYKVTFVDGNYEITARKVTVAFDESKVGGIYGKKIDYVEFSATVIDENGQSIVLDNNEGFVITIWYGEKTDKPTNAGSYTVTVTANGNSNYELANDPTLTFVIEKFSVDVSKISVQTKVYDGTARKPEILIEADADFTADIFRVTSDYSGFITAKDYLVELKLDDFDNYKWSNSNTAYTTVTFTIDLAGIYAKPFGEMTYGGAFDKSLVQWEFVYAESGKAVPEEEIINIDYDALSFMFDQDIDLDRPLAKTYGITCAVDATGRVIGLTNGNFNITLQKNDGEVIYGEFVVNPKEITIIAGSSQSIYSQDPASYLSYGFTLDLTIDGNSLADGEILTDIIKQYTPSVNANANSNVGSYTVTATAQADNYTVTVKSGAHEIVPITVKAVLEATNGVYNTTNVTYGVKELIATNLEGGYSFGSILDGKLTLDITGTLNSGASYVYDGSLPKDAGRYVVTVTAVSGSKNFVLDENDWVQTASFVIDKKTIEESNIVNVEKVYIGMDQSHGIENGEGYTVSEKMFKNVGEHNVTLTLTDSYNYEWSDHKQDVTITRVFKITKATLTLTPNGAITYGESFDENVRLYGFTLDNLQGDDVNKDNDEIVKGTVKYLLANGIDGTKLSVKDGGYVMLADVSGLSSDNYNIKTADGLLIVNKRAISIRPDSSESVYGEQVVVSQTFKVVNGELANGDDKSVIEYLAATVATETSDAGEYAVTANAANANYDITVLNGTHTIKKAKVGVQIRAVNGTYGNDNGSLVKFMSTVVINSDNTTKPISHLQFVISYDGTANDGTDYVGREAPTKAGIYIATVVEVLSGNYELDASYGISSTAVEICKRQIDASLITAENAAYTGKAIVPEINDSNYNVDGKVIYRAELDGEYVNVRSYDITLSLVDVDNYEWVDNLNKTTTIKFNIVKAENSLIDVNNPNAPAQSVKVIISDWTFGGEVSKPIANVASGDSNIVFEYSTSENGAYTTEVPQNAGEYWVRATVAASDNYNAFVSGATRFVISKKTVASPIVTNLDKNSVYTGSMLSLTIDGFDDQIMSLTLDEDMYRSDNGGKLNLLALNANTYTAVFKLRNADNYEWSDNAQLVDGAVVVNWTVERQVIKRLPNAEHKILVNGEDIVFIPEGFNSGIMTIEGNVHAHEGYFTAVITLKDTTNYVWEGTDSPSITVDFELTGTNTAFIAAICVVAGLCVGLATMAVILTLVNRRKKRKQAEAIDARSRAEGWEEE